MRRAPAVGENDSSRGGQRRQRRRGEQHRRPQGRTSASSHAQIEAPTTLFPRESDGLGGRLLPIGKSCSALSGSAGGSFTWRTSRSWRGCRTSSATVSSSSVAVAVPTCASSSWSGSGSREARRPRAHGLPGFILASTGRLGPAAPTASLLELAGATDSSFHVARGERGGTARRIPFARRCDVCPVLL
jgi:hypothetical protein